MYKFNPFALPINTCVNKDSIDIIDSAIAALPQNQTLTEYQTEASSTVAVHCDTDNSLDLSLPIESLNNLSQELFAISTTTSINSYANLLLLVNLL
ncbi:MAG: hypothetical protein GY928_29970 [Colwellia sp.]|nr:hypothetical protein [Colwellia sp.]